MIDFSLSEEERAVRDTIRQFIQQEVMPLEDQVLRNERNGLPPLEPGQLEDLQTKAKAGGWWTCAARRGRRACRCRSTTSRSSTSSRARTS